MALTLEQKASVRLYLGYPDNFRYVHTRLESVLDNLSEEAETQIETLLTRIAAIDLLLTSAAPGFIGNIKRVDEITFQDNHYGGVTVGLKNAKEVGGFYIGRLSIVTGVPIYGRYFGSSGWPGDSFFGGFGTGGSGSSGLFG
jgi:hypothetical protein